MDKNNFNLNSGKWGMVFFALFFVCISSACGKGKVSDIHAEIQQYEWTDLYVHSYDYEETCDILFTFLPVRFQLQKEFFDSLEVKKTDDWDIVGSELQKCFIPAYGGKYMNGIPMKNRQSWEECYATTLELIRTLHQEYIEMGIIQKKSGS